jgi:hypothetical protein
MNKVTWIIIGVMSVIILFVALGVLANFSLFKLQEKQGQLIEEQREQKEVLRSAEQDTLKNVAREHCNNVCADASSKRCSAVAMASLCVSYANNALSPDAGFLDLNNDGIMGADDTLLEGVVVCEDAIPCHALLDTCCEQLINHNTCKEFLNDYWTSDPEENNKETIMRLKDILVQKGSCYSETDQFHWYNVADFNAIPY